MPAPVSQRREPRARMVALALPTGNTNHDSPATPPTEFRVFSAGTNASEKGDFLFDERAASLVMDHAKKWANRFPFDWCHKMVRMDGPDPAEDGKASGWFTPELRDGELWATNITWTTLARQKISDREFVYFSPAFNVDDEERVIELTNVALTNLPAMHAIEQLVAADARPIALGFVPDDGGPPIVDKPWDKTAALGRLRDWAGIDDPLDVSDAALKKYAKAFAYVADDGKKLGDYKLPHHDIVGGKFVTVRAGVIAAGNAIQGARGGVDIPAGNVAKVKAHLAMHYHAMKMKAPWEADTREPPQVENAQAATTVQTIVVAKSRAKTLAEARTIAKKFAKGDPGKADETSTSWRFRQRDPGEFVAGSFRTIQPTDGVSLVIGHLKKAKAEGKAMTKDELKDAIHAKHEKIHGEMYDEGMRASMAAKLDEMKMDDLKAYDEKLAKFAPAGDGDEPEDGKRDSTIPPPPPKKADDAKADEKKDAKADERKADDKGDEESDRKHSRGASDSVLLERIAKLENKLESVERDKAADKRQVILDAASKDGKLTPADMKGESERGKFIRTLSNEQLAPYLRTLGKAVSTEETEQKASAGRGGRTFSVEIEKGKKVSVTLSREDVEVCNSLGTDLEAFAKTRAREAESVRRFRADDAEN